MADHADFYFTVQERMDRAISALPTLSKSEIAFDDPCPICLNSFRSIYEGKAQSEGTLVNPAAGLAEVRGVTKLEGCGHVFCKLDLVEWITGRHGTCPTCRHQFANIRPISESDYESSDGDYIPGEDDEDDDASDGFLDTDDFDGEDLEFEVDEMNIEMEDGQEVYLDVEINTDPGSDIASYMDPENSWDGGDEDEEMDNWGLSDGDGSESLSEGDVFVSGDEGLEAANDAEVYEGSHYLSADEGSDVEEPK